MNVPHSPSGVSLTKLAAASLTCLASVSGAAAEPIHFNRDIRPILADACFHCHGPDPGSRKALLRLDTEGGFFAPREGEPTVLKGQPDKSTLYQRLITTDEDDLMPPKESHRELKPEQKELIKRWIAEGAPWQPHWSLIPPTRPALPEPVAEGVPTSNPVDRFVQAKLQKAGLQPAQEAERHTLARRVALDLTGLPPAPELVESYVNDKAPDAYEKLVDKLLQSDRYGEHRARYWLDAARYADTHGLHFDKYREMWLYRDWVVQAFNKNQPFDQFTVEQIAGDLLQKPTESQLIATGFQRCNITTNEGGTIDEETLANYAADRVQTLSWIYMGLTANCSQCHDHKFDPITQRDYYSLAAFFRNTTQPAKDGNVKANGPILTVPSDEDRPRWAALPAEIAIATQARDERKKTAKPEYDQWLAKATPESLDADLPEKGLVTHIPLNEGEGKEVLGTCEGPKDANAEQPVKQVAWKPDGKTGPAAILSAGHTFDLGATGDFDTKDAFSYGGWINAGKAGISSGIIAKMDEKNAHRGWDLFQADKSLAVHLINQWPNDSLKVSTKKAVLKPGQWQHVFVTYNGSGKASGVKMYVNGVEEPLKVDNDTLKGSIKTATTLKVGQRSQGSVFDGGSVQDVRIYDRNLAAGEIKALADQITFRTILATAPDKRAPKEQGAIYDYYLATRDGEFKKAHSMLSKLEAEKGAIAERSPVTHIQEEKMNSPAMANVLMRGQYDKVGEAVEAAVPAALGKLPEGAPKNRLGLAQWIVDPQNSLTARVTVNRFWQELFGQGIVKTPDDFGIMGAAPSNPELLDWLAVEFRESGWDVKKLFRLLVTSSSYRQAATVTPEKLEKDRDNSLLSRGPRFRMDAEMIRDYALSASQTLSPKMGGPGTKPYQPENIWEVVGLGTEKYAQDNGENLYRRTLYNFWKRMSPPPNMDAFNAPSREVSCVRRERTNTPLQALVTMNDPQFVEAARNLAQKAIFESNGDSRKGVDTMAQRILCRPLSERELEIVNGSLQALLESYQANPEAAKALITVGESKPDAKLDAVSLAAWTMLANQLMNLDEVLNK